MFFLFLFYYKKNKKTINYFILAPNIFVAQASSVLIFVTHPSVSSCKGTATLSGGSPPELRDQDHSKNNFCFICKKFPCFFFVLRQKTESLRLGPLKSPTLPYLFNFLQSTCRTTSN